MKDLSVFDVQKALREHAQWGHDVTKHPHQSIVRDQPYGLRLGAQLRLPGDGSSKLQSYLMQAERPVISSVNSFIITDSPAHKALLVKPLFPTVETEQTEQRNRDFPSSHFTNGLFTGGIKMSEDHHNYREILATEHGIEDPEGPYIARNSSVHEVLRSHQKDEFPHFGINIDWGSASHKTLFSPIPHASQNNFNAGEAISHLIHPREAGAHAGFVKPLSGLIVVSSPHPKLGYGLDRIHTYDPNTEELRLV